MKKLLLLILATAFLGACSSGDETDAYLDLPAIPFDYTSISSNAVHESNDNAPADNPVTNHGATLGRVLFYEKALSANNTVSCASCHKQEFSFADNVAKSQGVNGPTIRNSMHLVNVRHVADGKMFWDFRANSLEEQTLMPIQDHIEMDLTLEEAVAKLETRPYYAKLFRNAFGSGTITPERISKALSQFIRSLTSYNSPFDRNEPRTTQEQLGFEKYFTPSEDSSNPDVASCTECHSDIQQMEFDHNGLPNLAFPLNVNGRGFEDEPNLMKVANIRNIALTAPYGHDGRYATLEILLQNHGNNVSEADIPNLIAFLNTLTDESFVTDERFSDPFR